MAVWGVFKLQIALSHVVLRPERRWIHLLNETGTPGSGHNNRRGPTCRTWDPPNARAHTAVRAHEEVEDAEGLALVQPARRALDEELLLPDLPRVGPRAGQATSRRSYSAPTGLNQWV